jgi:hypothetical protein
VYSSGHLNGGWHGWLPEYCAQTVSETMRIEAQLGYNQYMKILRLTIAVATLKKVCRKQPRT